MNDSEWYQNCNCWKFNMVHIITNLWDYCGRSCDYQISIFCVLYYRDLYLKAKMLLIVAEKGIRYLWSDNEKGNRLPYLCLMIKGVTGKATFVGGTWKEQVSGVAGTRLSYVCPVQLSTLLVLDPCYIIPVTKHICRSCFPMACVKFGQWTSAGLKLSCKICLPI